MPRVWAAPPWMPASRRWSASRSSGVSTSSASEGTSTTSAGHSGRLGVGHVPTAAVRAEARREHVGRGEQQRVRAGAVAVGDDQGGALTGGVDEQLLELFGVEQRAISGDEQRPLDPVLERGLDALCGRRVVAALVVLDDGRAVAAGDPLGDAVAADDDRPARAPVRGGARRARRRTSRRRVRGGRRRSARSEAAAWLARSS